MEDFESNVGALRGIRVVDFGQYLSAPMVAMFLADNGADVIHIDPPEGPRWDHPANAALYRGKRSISLDLKTDTGRAEARRLMLSADIVTENFRPGVMQRLGLGADSITKVNRRLVWCSIPGFAADDPRATMPAWEGIVCSAAGLYPSANFAAGDPVFTALPLASNFGAFLAAHRIAAALLERLKSGKGQHIEVSLFEACFQAIGFYAEVPVSRDLSGTLLSRVRPLMKMRKAADGTYLYFDSPLRGLQAFLDRFLPGRDLLMMKDSELEQVSKELDDLIQRKPGADWERICQEEIKGAFGLVQNLPDWLEDRHALESATIVPVDDANFGMTAQPGYPVLLSRSTPRVRWGRGKANPSLGTEIEWLEPQHVEPRVTTGTAGSPLDGIRVLDCSTLLAGPTSARILAQYGADVIKIDRAGIASGDVDPLSDDEFAFIGSRTVSAGKRMMFLDLKKPAGQEILRSMASRADIVHHNFTPDAAARLGVSAEQLRDVNASIILSTMSLHSHGGFRAEYRGHDMLGQMITGMGHRAGGAGEPQVVSTVLNDNAAGHLHAFGIMLALLHRYRSGEGQDVNSSLSRTATLHQVPFMVGFPGRKWDEPTGPKVRGWHTFDRLYQAKDGWFYVFASRVNGRRLLEASSTFAAAIDVTEQDLDGWIEEKVSRLSVDSCVRELSNSGFVAHRYVTLPELVNEPYVFRRELLAIVDHPGIGRALGVGLKVYDSSAIKPTLVLAARRPGMDTIDLLREHGFGDRIGDLLHEKVIAIGEAAILNTPESSGFWTRVNHGAQARMAGIAPTTSIIEKISTQFQR